ncbi:hypothetical protein ACE41H_02265 [Paenibacillus enshidis]|uniref:Uncharacterized protein n=1 Tax=Paenibacillus enshidis TaxID=1458439 RepID=A0ABV5AN66_9BACL
MRMAFHIVVSMPKIEQANTLTITAGHLLDAIEYDENPERTVWQTETFHS